MLFTTRVVLMCVGDLSLAVTSADPCKITILITDQGSGSPFEQSLEQNQRSKKQSEQNNAVTLKISEFHHLTTIFSISCTKMSVSTCKSCS